MKSQPVSAIPREELARLAESLPPTSDLREWCDLTAALPGRRVLYCDSEMLARCRLASSQVEQVVELEVEQVIELAEITSTEAKGTEDDADIQGLGGGGVEPIPDDRQDSADEGNPEPGPTEPQPLPENAGIPDGSVVVRVPLMQVTGRRKKA